MSQNRKDEHLKIAKVTPIKSNAFDHIRLEGTDLPNLSIADIDLSTYFLNMKVPYPIYINAMTGGSKKSYQINEFLAKIARHFNLPMVSGSQSIIFKKPKTTDSFTVIRDHHQGIVVANINANMNLEKAQYAMDVLKADALTIHLNVIQELIMTEGDRDFRLWSKHIKEIVNHLDKPVMVKQVGTGMSLKTIDTLKKLGVKNIDISGSGGTSFIDIESERSGRDYKYLSDFSKDTATILMDLKAEKDLNIYASGGIRNPLDVIKSLVLGAKAVGLSKWFLDLTEKTFDEAIDSVSLFLEDLKKIMLILGVCRIEDLNRVKYEIIK